MLWTIGTWVAMLAGGLVIGRYLMPYRERPEDMSDRRLAAEMDRLEAELELRGEDWPDEDEPDELITRGERDDDWQRDLSWPDEDEPDEGRTPAIAAPEPASEPNDSGDGWQPAPGDRIAAWARTAPQAPHIRLVQPNRFMDLVAAHLTEYDLHHMQRAAA